MTVINLRERKLQIENLMKSLQIELNHINTAIKAEEVTSPVVEKTEEELLLECGTFSIGKEITERLAEKQVSKKEKLTKAQQQVMDAVKKAIPYYKFKYNEGLRELTHYVNSDLYIDGKSVNHELNESKARCVYQKSYYHGDGVYSYEMSSNTLKALERKGYINIVKDNGIGLDIFTLVDEQEAPEVHTEFSRIYFEYGDKYNHIKSVFCPIGQEEITIEMLKTDYDYTELKVVDTEIQKVDTWNGR